jgi:hypothetical protein
MRKLTIPAAVLFAAAMILGACSHHRAAVDNSSGVASGEIRPADTNATQPAGPAVVDSTGRVYTSSNTGAGNAATAGTNTNVSTVPNSTSGSSTLTVTEQPSTTNTNETMVSSSNVQDQTATPSSTTTETTTTTTSHRRMHKD